MIRVPYMISLHSERAFPYTARLKFDQIALIDDMRFK